MIKNKLLPIVGMLLLAFIPSFGQNEKIENYIIITRERAFSNGPEGILRSYWIIPEDSIIKQSKISIYPLLLNFYNKKDIDSCIKGLDINPLAITETLDEEIPIDSIQQDALNKTLLFARKNRKELQMIKKTWSSDRWSSITYYGTAVSGTFCKCRFDKWTRYDSRYEGPILMVNSTISLNDNFWKSSKAEILLNKDYTEFNFDYYIQFNSFRYGKKYKKNKKYNH